MTARNRRRVSSSRRRPPSRGYGQYSNRRHGRHQVSPLTRIFTTVALWAIVIYAIGSGAIQLSGK
jgi:hypothetical protein